MYNKILFISVLIFIIILFILSILKKKNEKFDFQLDKKFDFQLDKKLKLKLFDECNFSGHGFNDKHEKGECSVAIQIIPLVNNVLEIGGGAGKVSHIINKILKKRNLQKKHIVIEPGKKGIGNHKDKIYKNKKKFKDQYTIIKKFAEDLTNEDLNFIPDCLFVDCEGCLHKFFETDIGKYCLKNARYIVNENDSMAIKKNQQDLRDIFIKYGFSKIAIGYGCGVNCHTEVWFKEK